MSYARFSNSDVYVYHDSRGHLTCCMCEIGPDLETKSRTEMVEHMRAHEKVGHDTGDVILGLLEEIEAIGDAVTEEIGAWA